MSRIRPRIIDPVEFEGLRYAQIFNGESEGLDQRSGYLCVTDIATAQRIATIKAYVVPFDPHEEADVQDVFFTRMQLDATNRRLLIENERRQRVRVAIASHAVSPAP